MIKCNKGTLEASGNKLILMAEATLVISKIAEIIAEDSGKTKKEVMKVMISTVKQSDEYMKEGK